MRQKTAAILITLQLSAWNLAIRLLCIKSILFSKWGTDAKTKKIPLQPSVCNGGKGINHPHARLTSKQAQRQLRKTSYDRYADEHAAEKRSYTLENRFC